MQPMGSLKPSIFKSAKIIMAGVDFESFARELEKANQESHKIAMTAYFLAGLAALASFVVSLL